MNKSLAYLVASNVVILLLGQWVSGSFQARSQLAAIAVQVQAIESSVSEIKADLKNMPDKDDLLALDRQMREADKRLEDTDKSLADAIKVNAARIADLERLR